MDPKQRNCTRDIGYIRNRVCRHRVLVAMLMMMVVVMALVVAVMVTMTMMTVMIVMRKMTMSKADELI